MKALKLSRFFSKLLFQPVGIKKLTGSVCRTFFWSAKVKNIENVDEIASMKNLNFLINQLKESNRLLKPLLPIQEEKFKDKLTVVMDMDDVLLFSFYPDETEAYLLAPKRFHDFSIPLPELDTHLHIYKRNHLDEFLEYLKENCEPILFCNGVKEYVDKVMDVIDPSRIFAHRFYQDSCSNIVLAEEDLNELTKDLERLGRDLKKTVYIDSKAINFWCNPENCIPILEYDGQFTEKDHRLLDIIDVLEEAKGAEDVRELLAKKFEIRRMLEESKML